MAGSSESKSLRGPIQINSDAINCLVYAYLQDSGLQHTAFAIRKEAHLERSSMFHSHIPRGELVGLLYKALAYIEVECHFRSQDEATKRCVAPFSLLEPHLCSSVHKSPSSTIVQPLPAIAPTPSSRHPDPSRDTSATASGEDAGIDRKTSKSQDHGTKRKAENVLTEVVSEKRVRIEPQAASQPPLQQNNSQVAKVTNPAPTINYLPGHTAETFYVAFNPKFPSILASGSKDATVHIWNLDLLEEAPVLSNSAALTNIRYFYNPKDRDLTCLLWDNSGELLSVGSIDHHLRVIKREDSSIYLSSKDHTAAVFAVKFSPSGRSILTASLDGSVSLWDTATKKRTKKYKSHTGPVLDVAWISETMFASCSQDSRICVHLSDRTQAIKIFQGHRSEVTRIFPNKSSTKLASCAEDQTLKVWNIQNLGEDDLPGFTPPPVTLVGHTQTISTMAWCPALRDNGHEMIVSASFDKTCKVWDADAGTCLKTFSNQSKPLYALGMCPNGRWVATGSGDSQLHVHDLKSLTTVWSHKINAPRSAIFDIDWQYLNDGQTNRFAIALESAKVGIVDLTMLLGT